METTTSDKNNQPEALDASQQIAIFKDFFEKNYEVELLEKIRKCEKFIVVDFFQLTRFSPEIVDLLLEQPEEVLKGAEIALEHIDEKAKGFAVRIKNLPSTSKLMISNIRSVHLGKFFLFEGVVRIKTEVRPQVTSARFECPSCGNVLSILQLDNKFKEPQRCSCGRKGKFRLLNKELVDAQGLTLEEVPEQLDGGEQPKRITVLLKNDLVSPFSEKKTSPGSRVIITGHIKEIPIILRSGGQSTKFDIIIEANHVDSIQEDYIDININEEEKKKIIELSQDKELVKKMVQSLAPSIYGHDKIKEALVLQLMGGVRKVRDDGVVTRGDMHILLVGDPGAAKCLSGETLVVLNDGSQKHIKEIVEPLLGKENKRDISSFNIFLPSFNSKGKLCKSKIIGVSKRTTNKIIHIKSEQGSQIRATPNHPFFVINDGLIIPKSAKELNEQDFVAVPKLINCEATLQQLPQKINRVKANNAKHITLPPYCTEEMARFLGYLVGDGYCAYTKTSGWATLTGNDHELLDDFSVLVKKLFSLKTTLRKPHKDKSAYESYTISKELVAYLEMISPELLQGARKKTVPECILKSSHNVIASFIRALFDCDGTTRSNRREISLTSANRELVEQIKLLLKRFGIASQIHTKYQCATNSIHKKKDYYYQIYISGDNVVLFHDYIGFSLERKQQKIQLYTSKSNPNLAVIPKLGKIMKKLRTSLGISQFSIGIPRTTYQHYERGDRNPTHFSLSKVVSEFENEIKSAYLKPPLLLQIPDEISMNFNILKMLSESQIGWEKISSVQAQDVNETVYDLEIEETHNFIANGFIVHNSQMLKRISIISPKSKYVTGKSASAAGLSATVVRDEILQGWSLEAGALVLANKGICCIDELDKMSKEDSWALHEALEQQSISISKANIQATLRCETTVLAAANPKWGRFDPYDTVANQIDLPPTLINRFDLIFPIKDLPDITKDEKMASFILELHKNNVEKPAVDTKLLRKYIAYAKQHVFPRLTDAAVEELKNYYIKMRGSATGDGVKSIPISARQLEGLVRLSEASARLRMSDKVLQSDAQKAIELLDYCLRQVAYDEKTGTIDIDRIATEMPATQRNKIILVKEIIVELENALGKNIPIEEIIKKGEEKGLSEADIEEVIQKLKRGGDVYEPKKGFISKI